jgi:hypothetical protein
MCRAKNGELLTNKNQVLARWKDHFEEHLNEGSELEQPTRPVDLRDDGDDIDLPSREEIGICVLNVTYKVFAKTLYDRLLPHANAAVQHNHAGFQSGRSTTDQLFALRQILEKCNEFNTTTHHLFIDLK